MLSLNALVSVSYAHISHFITTMCQSVVSSHFNINNFEWKKKKITLSGKKLLVLEIPSLLLEERMLLC